MNKKKTRLIGFTDLVLGMLLCSFYLPTFIKNVYFNLGNSPFSQSTYVIISIQYIASCSIGILYVVAGISLIYFTSVGYKMHLCVILPLGLIVSITLISTGVTTLFKYKYAVPFAVRYLIIGLIIGIYSSITYLIMRKEISKKSFESI